LPQKLTLPPLSVVNHSCSSEHNSALFLPMSQWFRDLGCPAETLLMPSEPDA